MWFGVFGFCCLMERDIVSFNILCLLDSLEDLAAQL